MAGATERLAHVAELRPEICTIDCGTMNFAAGGDYVMTNTPAMLRAMAEQVRALGVKPELEVFDTGHLVFVNELIRDGLIDDPPLIQLCMGIPYGAPDDPTTLLALVQRLPANAVFSAFSIGRMQLPYAALAPIVGGNVRVGLEDNLFLARGQLATNAELVERAVTILEALNVRVLGPDEVRERLGVAPWLRTVGLLGGGVIGGGWAARFVLNGTDVRVFDPDPEAPRKLDEVLANARRAFGRLTLAPLPAEGAVTFVGSAEEAAEGVELVQESAPERLELKQSLLQAASRAAAPDTLLCSSTSGPAALRAAARPERLPSGSSSRIRSTPSICCRWSSCAAGPRRPPETISRAAAAYRAVGMHPLVVRTEIDGFIADRLLEAMWREALWLVNDDVATVAEIDDAMRYGAGLRFALMGTFLTYRIAGGEAGMRHFLAQFGPALQWPWTKLTDVPELTDELVDKIAAQSDAQAAGRSIRELEQLRDDCLVALLQGLRGHALRRRRDARRLGARPARRAAIAGALAPLTRACPGRLGRLQRPRSREPVPAALRRRDRRAARGARRRRAPTSRRAPT